MGLLHPTPGEIFDRLSILDLKIKAAKEKVKEWGHFDIEADELKKYAQDTQWSITISGEEEFYGLEIPSSIKVQVAELSSINKTLWRLEDDRRVLLRDRRRDVLAIVQNTESTTFFNDQRARLIADINYVFGITSKEKLYDEAKLS